MEFYEYVMNFSLQPLSQVIKILKNKEYCEEFELSLAKVKEMIMNVTEDRKSVV